MPPIICDENEPGRERAEHTPHAHLAGVSMHRSFDEVCAEGRVRISVA
jgi:hypothetical protein